MGLNFLVFGNHPRLALAEFLAFEPKADILANPDKACVVHSAAWQDKALMDQLGGTVKLGEVIRECDKQGIEPDEIAKMMVEGFPAGSLEFGWTVYGGDNKQKKYFEKYPIKIKKALKEMGWKVRWVTGQDGEPLSPAAVAKCHLTEKPNADLCLIIEKEKIYLGRTTQVQNADAWSLRDYGRPFRDDANGMLPPKLARVMVNLARVPKGAAVLDPFCGSGTVMMEAALATAAGKIIGSDIDAKQIKDTQGNLEWLAKEKVINSDDKTRFQVFTADVKQIGKHLSAGSIDAIITEGWLGPALRGRETAQEIKKNAEQISQLWSDALKALRPILKDSARIVAVFPSFKLGSQIIRTDDKLNLESLGYQLEELPANIRMEDLYYERTGQHLRRNIRLLRAG
ncbi:MAG: DNA methyltransferase [Patescibacteria group bacterium]|nr:DNA methyltransferase [Patescibacteria group bacterium]